MKKHRRRAAAAAAATGAAAVMYAGGGAHPHCVITNDLPSRSCTPGAFDVTITKTDVCDGAAAARPRRVSTAMKQQVIVNYGLDPKTFHGEIDHLVSRELGGTDVESNLWPEVGPIPNAKDTQVENPLKRAICDGRVSLAEAQRRIATDWHTAMRGLQ